MSTVLSILPTHSFSILYTNEEKKEEEEAEKATKRSKVLWVPRTMVITSYLSFISFFAGFVILMRAERGEPNIILLYLLHRTEHGTSCFTVQQFIHCATSRITQTVVL